MMFEQLVHKTVTTVHGRLDLKDLSAAYKRWPHFRLVSISNHQRRPLPQANWIATVPHGLPADLYRYCAQPTGGYLAFLGRISPEKRPDLAIQLAQRSRLPLKIAAKVDAVDLAYFATVIKPLLKDPLVDFIGEIDDEHKSAFLGNAVGLLFPIHWPEPFGLVMIEAMACGTPVIAWNCGAVPEVIEHGVTGFIVDSEAQALSAIASLPRINRRTVRAAFEQRFTATTMTRAYLDVYAHMLEAPTSEPGSIKIMKEATYELAR